MACREPATKAGMIGTPAAFDPGEVKKRYHLHPGHSMALFSGEISHAAGADLLMSYNFV